MRQLNPAKFPPLPKAEEEGNVPAVEYVRASIARDGLETRNWKLETGMTPPHPRPLPEREGEMLRWMRSRE